MQKERKKFMPTTLGRYLSTIINIENISKWHYSRLFWSTVATLCASVFILMSLVLDDYLQVSLYKEFGPVRLSILLIFIGSIICAANPKKLVTAGYGAGVLGTVFGIKHCCLLWTIYKISEARDHAVHKGSILEHWFSGAFKNFLLKDSSTLNTIPHHILLNTVYIYTTLFMLILLTLCITFTCSNIKKYLAF